MNGCPPPLEPGMSGIPTAEIGLRGEGRRLVGSEV